MLMQSIKREDPKDIKSLYKSQLQKTEWTFLDASTKKYTHALHLYPARMHPEIPKRIIEKYAKDKKDVVLDPFMGSGSVVLEGILHGNQTIGIDINPFAVLLSKVKTTVIYQDLNLALEVLISNFTREHIVEDYHFECLPNLIDFKNWYNSDSLDILSTLKHNILKITDKDIRDFFLLCFSLTVRKTSYQRNGAWKIHRMTNADKHNFHPKPLDIFKLIAESNISKMNDLVNASPKGIPHVLLGDSRDIAGNLSKVNKNILKDNKVNLVVTSPPYGDHATTMAYGQFSKHSSLWLDLPQEQSLAVDAVGLGGKHKTGGDLGSEILNTTLDHVRKNDIELSKNKKPCRTESVYSFFYDLDECLDQISKNLVPEKSHCCFVLANRTVRRVVIPTDLITMELGLKHGFKIDKVIERNIPNKSMPAKNAPENITKDPGKTMTRESIIIMRY